METQNRASSKSSTPIPSHLPRVQPISGVGTCRTGRASTEGTGQDAVIATGDSSRSNACHSLKIVRISSTATSAVVDRKGMAITQGKESKNNATGTALTMLTLRAVNRPFGVPNGYFIRLRFCSQLFE